MISVFIIAIFSMLTLGYCRHCTSSSEHIFPVPRYVWGRLAQLSRRGSWKWGAIV